MLASDGARACLEAFTATMLLTHQMTLPIFIVTACVLRHRLCLLRACVRRPRAADDQLGLQPANALLGITNNAMNVFGPAVAGILIVFTAPAGSSHRRGQFPCERLVPDAAARPARAPAAQHVRARAARRAAGGDVAQVGARADHRLAITNFCFAAFIVLGP
jgi:hypothetical protein